jgi:hypothetical protein
MLQSTPELLANTLPSTNKPNLKSNVLRQAKFSCEVVLSLGRYVQRPPPLPQAVLFVTVLLEMFVTTPASRKTPPDKSTQHTTATQPTGQHKVLSAAGPAQLAAQYYMQACAIHAYVMPPMTSRAAFVNDHLSASGIMHACVHASTGGRRAGIHAHVRIISACVQRRRQGMSSSLWFGTRTSICNRRVAENVSVLK